MVMQLSQVTINEIDHLFDKNSADEVVATAVNGFIDVEHLSLSGS